MTKFTYQDTEYEYVDPDTWTTLEALRLHQASGIKPVDLLTDFNEFGPIGFHALAWMTVRRAGVDVAWDDFELPYFPTVAIMTGEVHTPADPSPASTPPRKAARARRPSPAQSKKS